MIEFFNESKEQSIVKSEIVSKYFYAWANTVLTNPYVSRIAYIDLFSGPGKYVDGTHSTPLRILETISNTPKLKEAVVTIFNDASEKCVEQLRLNIKEIDNIDELEYEPIVWNEEVGDEIAKIFEGSSLVPSFVFIDPFGYKGISQRLLNSLLKDWGSDCVFFFNYNRINMGITNNIVETHMRSIFGDDTFDELVQKIEDKTPYERELLVVEYLTKSLKRHDAEYVLPFKFQRTNSRTSHYLVFTTKHPRGLEIMKEIMASSSSKYEDGVASFSYIPVQEEDLSTETFLELDLLAYFARPVDELAIDLMDEFSGKTMKMREIYENHHVDTPFTRSNYKEALRRLESQNEIITDPPANKRRNRNGVKTFADHVKVTFPHK